MLKNKSRWVQCPRPTRVPHSCNARSSRTDKGKRSRVGFRLELGVAALARGFTHAVPPHRLPLTAANSRPKQGIKINSCRASDRKTTGAGKTKFAGILTTRMESSGDVRQTLYMILEGRT
jgi:hypothetical protein